MGKEQQGMTKDQQRMLGNLIYTLDLKLENLKGQRYVDKTLLSDMWEQLMNIQAAGAIEYG